MRMRIKKGFSCLLLLVLLLSLLPGTAWAGDGIEELDLDMIEIVEQDPEEDITPAVPGEGTDDGETVGIWNEPEDDPAGEEQPDLDEDPQEAGTSGEEDPAVTEPEADQSDELPFVDTDMPESKAGSDLHLFVGAALEQNFRLSLYVALPEGADPAQYTVKTVFNAQLSERIIERELSAADLQDGLYVVADIAEARAYQLTAPVDITVSSGAAVLRHTVYSVRDYLKALGAADEKYAAFCLAALCYGGAVQRWLAGSCFTLNGEALEYEVYIDDPADADLTAPQPVKPTRQPAYAGEVPGLKSMAARFEVGTETALRFYFECPQAPTALEAANEGHAVSGPFAQNGGIWYADLTGIKATELANDFVLSAAVQGQPVQIMYSPYCYAAQNWDSGNAALSALCRMLVAWGNEAAALAAAEQEGQI